MTKPASRMTTGGYAPRLPIALKAARPEADPKEMVHNYLFEHPDEVFGPINLSKIFQLMGRNVPNSGGRREALKMTLVLEMAKPGSNGFEIAWQYLSKHPNNDIGPISLKDMEGLVGKNHVKRGRKWKPMSLVGEDSCGGNTASRTRTSPIMKMKAQRCTCGRPPIS